MKGMNNSDSVNKEQNTAVPSGQPLKDNLSDAVLSDEDWQAIQDETSLDILTIVMDFVNAHASTSRTMERIADQCTAAFRRGVCHTTPTDELVDEVQRRMDAIVDAAVAWRQGGADNWEEESTALDDAVDRLLELRSSPIIQDAASASELSTTSPEHGAVGFGSPESESSESSDASEVRQQAIAEIWNEAIEIVKEELAHPSHAGDGWKDEDGDSRYDCEYDSAVASCIESLQAAKATALKGGK